MPETLIGAVKELEEAYEEAKKDLLYQNLFLILLRKLILEMHKVIASGLDRGGRMVEIEIREIRGREDLDAIKTIESLSGLHERDWEKHLRTFDKSMEKDSKTFVCTVQGEIVGKVELIIGEEKGEPRGYVRRLAVHPNHREKGYAKKLMNHILSFAKEKGIKTLDLHVTENNKPAIKLYKSLGFYTRHKEIHLRKNLTPSV